MANNIMAQVTGGAVQTLNNVETVADVKRKLGVSQEYTALVNGNPKEGSYSLKDYEQVILSPNVKGA